MAYNYSVITKSCFVIEVVIIFELCTKKVTVNGKSFPEGHSTWQIADSLILLSELVGRLC